MLTPRQREVLDFLHYRKATTGLMPSTREIQQEFGFCSQTAAIDLLRALERKGVLRRLPGVARGIILTEPSSATGTVISIPLYGAIAAGFANNASEMHGEFLKIDSAATGLGSAKGCFALRVRGDSMIDAHILDGDYVILDSIRTPRHRDVVAALIDGETTLKRLMIDGQHRWLKAENRGFPDLIPADSLQIQGLMCALIRGHEAQRESAD